MPSRIVNLFCLVYHKVKPDFLINLGILPLSNENRLNRFLLNHVSFNDFCFLAAE